MSEPTEFPASLKAVRVSFIGLPEPMAPGKGPDVELVTLNQAVDH